MYYLIFIDGEGKQYRAKATVGHNLLKIAKENGVPLKGNCGGSMSCNTCHVEVEEEFFMKEESLFNISDEEIDILELSMNCCFNSRLCCQIIFTTSMNGMVLKIKPESEGFCDH